MQSNDTFDIGLESNNSQQSVWQSGLLDCNWYDGVGSVLFPCVLFGQTMTNQPDACCDSSACVCCGSVYVLSVSGCQVTGFIIGDLFHFSSWGYSFLVSSMLGSVLYGFANCMLAFWNTERVGSFLVRREKFAKGVCEGLACSCCVFARNYRLLRQARHEMQTIDMAHEREMLRKVLLSTPHTKQMNSM